MIFKNMTADLTTKKESRIKPYFISPAVTETHFHQEGNIVLERERQ